MLFHYMHSYCGGRLLTGLYNPQERSLTPGYVWETCAKNYQSPLDGGNTKVDPYPYLPNDFVEFLQILRKFTFAGMGPDGYQGMIIAVTNSVQTTARDRYLPDAGFRQVGKYSKVGAANCITWIGDYREDIYPILMKVKDYQPKDEIKNESKFSRPTPPVQPRADFNSQQPSVQMYDTVRNSTVQTLRPATRRESPRGGSTSW